MKPTIALFIADPKCSIQSANGIIKALGNDFNFKIFSKSELEDGFFDGVSIIAIPGGFGDASSFESLFKYNQQTITTFIRNGGKYLGICMGAYWAGSYYLDILDSVDAVQYITRPHTDTRRPHAKAIDVRWKEQPKKMFFYDGCTLVGDKSKFKTIATYSNGDAMAIIQDNIGLIGCHPESEKFWYDGYSWMGKHWHNNAHHKILLDFVNELLNNS